MVRYRRLLALVVVLTLVVAGWASSLPTLALASVMAVPGEKAALTVTAAPVSSTGRLPPAQVVRFMPTTTGTVPANANVPRFRTRDDITFARDKRLSNSSSAVADPRSLEVSSVGLIRPSGESAEAVQTLFSGMSYDLQTSQSFGTDQRVWPPDTQIGVGTAQVIEFVNNSASIWMKTGQLVSVSDLNEFFIPPVDSKAFSISDPRIFFDSASGIWFSSAMAFDAFNNGRVYLNVSLTSDPTGLWNQYTIDTDNAGTLFDQPRFGVNQDKIVMTWDDYSASDFTGSETWVLDKAEIISGLGQPSFWRMGPDLNRFALMPSTVLSATATEYLVYNNADPGLSSYQGSPTLGIIAITGTPALGNVIWTETAAPVPDGAETVVPPDALQPNPGPPIATNDDRLLAAVWQNGVLWAAANDGCTPDGDVVRRSCLRLFQLTTAGPSPLVQQSFDIGSVGTYLAFPSIAFDAAGNVFLGLSGSSTLLSPSFLTSAVPVAGGSGGAHGLTILSSGLGPYNDCAPTCTLSPSNNNRWGDYGGAAVDPGDAAFVWIAGEYSASATNPLDWGTGVAEVSLVALATSIPSPTINASPTTPVDTPTSTPTQPLTVSATATPSTTPTKIPVTSPSETATPTTTEVGTRTAPTFTASATVTPIWIDLAVGQPTVVSTVVGSLPVTISIPSGETIAKIAVSLPDAPISIAPEDPSFHQVSGTAIVVVAIDSSGNPITLLDQAIQVSITFRPLPGDIVNPSFAQIYTIDNGSPQLLTTTVSPPEHGFFIATASTGHLSPFVIFAPLAGTPFPQSYLPMVAQSFQDSGW